jgi:hypothetical protein
MKHKGISASDMLLLSASNRAVEKFCKATPGRVAVKATDIGIFHALDDDSIGREVKYAGYDRTPEGMNAWEKLSMKVHVEQKPIELESLKSTVTKIERG